MLWLLLLLSCPSCTFCSKNSKVFLSHVPVLWCDNISTIALSSNPVFHSSTKHLEVDYHYVCEKVSHKDLCAGFVSSKDNLADIFTKPLSAPLFLLLRCKLLVDSSPFPLRADVENRSNLKNLKFRDDQIETTSKFYIALDKSSHLLCSILL